MRQQRENKSYKTALYLRLSKDDEGVGESSSITTQRSILREYAGKHGFEIADEYTDDGYSGTNYDRPEFKRMIADIQRGKIDCVITKDMSRLGRNSARTADLLDEYFPKHKVRYISVIDGYDSFNLTSGTAMTASFMTVMNEMYARDISNKIRSAFNAKMEKGEWIAPFPPYGYKKDTEHGNKNRLVIDYRVAHIIREIFRMAADGYPPREIAKHLNNNGVATPAVYRCITRPYLNLTNDTWRKEWTSSMICKMLCNEVYLGKTLQGKTGKISFKSKAVHAKSRDEWIVVENTHEPLVSEEVFKRVRARSVSRRNAPTQGFKNIFSGIAKCADCGRNMSLAPTKKKGAVYNLCCGGYKAYGSEECSNHFIDYDFLSHVVLQELGKCLYLSEEDKNEIAKEAEREEAAQTAADDKCAAQEVLDIKKRMRELNVLLKKLYEDRAFNRIDEAVYKSLTDDYTAELSALEKIATEPKTTEPRKERFNDYISSLDDITNMAELTPALLHKFIRRIEVEQGEYYRDESGKRRKRQKIRIYYCFSECAVK